MRLPFAPEPVTARFRLMVSMSAGILAGLATAALDGFTIHSILPCIAERATCSGTCCRLNNISHRYLGGQRPESCPTTKEKTHAQ